MPARLLDGPSACDVGDTLRLWLLVADNSGIAAAPDTVTVDLTLPSGASDTGTSTAQTVVGLYLLEYDVTSSGTHAVVVTVASTSFGNDVIALSVLARATSGSLPELQDVKDYLGEDSSYPDSDVQSALDAETVAQARACAIPVDYPLDLGEALKRRVARNLAARSVPVTSYTSFDGGGTSTKVPRIDAEIARLEGPFLKWVTA